MMRLSTRVEAEYVALSDASRKRTAVRSHLYEDLLPSILTLMISSNNQGALSTTEDPTNYARMKHIDLPYRFIRDCVDNGIFAVDYIP
jgi:hypothetical protein